MMEIFVIITRVSNNIGSVVMGYGGVILSLMLVVLLLMAMSKQRRKHRLLCIPRRVCDCLFIDHSPI